MWMRKEWHFLEPFSVWNYFNWSHVFQPIVMFYFNCLACEWERELNRKLTSSRSIQKRSTTPNLARINSVVIFHTHAEKLPYLVEVTEHILPLIEVKKVSWIHHMEVFVSILKHVCDTIDRKCARTLYKAILQTMRFHYLPFSIHFFLLLITHNSTTKCHVVKMFLE